MYIYIYIYIYIYVYTCVYIYIYMYVYISLSLYIYIYIYICLDIMCIYNVYTYVIMKLIVRLIHKYIYIYIYIYARHRGEEGQLLGVLSRREGKQKNHINCQKGCVGKAVAPRRLGVTPSSHSKNSLSNICSKGWIAQKPFFDR